MEPAPRARHSSTVRPSNASTSIRSGRRAGVGERVADDPDPGLDVEQRRLPRVGEDGHDHAVEDVRGPRDDVEVAVGDRIERAGIDRDVVFIDPPGDGRTSAPSRQTGARAPMLAVRPGRRRVPPEVLGDDPGARGEMRREGLEGRGDEQLRLGVGRVDEDDRRTGRRRDGLDPAKPGEHVGPDDGARAPRQMRPVEVRAMTAWPRRSRSTNVACAGAARQRLDPGGAAAREQVQDARAGQVRLEDREQRLLDPIAKRSGARARRLEPDAARRARR